jgi:energy-coupling factor transport system ATP-binding protein
MCLGGNAVRIEITGLEFVYPGGVEALRGVSLVIESGERVAIVGQNGAGKTTLVKHLNGLLQPARGSVTIGGWDTRKLPVAKLAQRVGYVFQNPDEQLFCKDVIHEVSFGPRNLGFPPERITELVKDAIRLMDLTGKETTNPYDLSPSWRKMLALASIVAMDTPVVILDEPTTGQDAKNVERIANLVDILHQRGKTVITITHDSDFCAENFSRMIAMAQGQVLLDGPTHEVMGKTEILATTYVEPAQITRLGQGLGLSAVVCTQDEFLSAYRSRVEGHPV